MFTRGSLLLLGSLLACGCAEQGSIVEHDLEEGGAPPLSSGDAEGAPGGGPGAGGGAPGGGGGAGPGTGAGAGPATGAAALEMWSGDGAVIPAGWTAGDPLRVRALGADGLPVAGANVSFEPQAGSSLHVQAPGNMATTDAQGVAGVMVNAFQLSPHLALELAEVTASWNGSSVSFGVIITQVPQGAAPASPLFQFEQPLGSQDLGSAKANTVLSGGLVVRAVMQQGPGLGQPVPGWGMRLTDTTDPLAPSAIACAGGTVIADAGGEARCDVVVPSLPGEYWFGVMAGGAVTFGGGHLLVVP